MTAKKTKATTKKAAASSAAAVKTQALRRFIVAGAGSMVLAALMVIAGHTLFRNHAGKPEAVLQNVWQALAIHDEMQFDKLVDRHAVARSIVHQLVDMDTDSRPAGTLYSQNMLSLLAPEIEIALQAQLDAFLKTGQFLSPTDGTGSFLNLLWQETGAKPESLKDILVGKTRDKTATVTLRLAVAGSAEPLSLVVGLTRDSETWKVTSLENLRPFIDGIYRARLQRTEVLNAPILKQLAEHLTFSDTTLLEEDGAPTAVRTVVANTGDETVIAFDARMTILAEGGQPPLYGTDIHHEGSPLLHGNAVDKVWPLNGHLQVAIPASATIVIEPYQLVFDNGTTLRLYTPGDL
ncbi:MAG: hypothetical protein GC134_07935 [Proteobacteria bacterium]|nr:hypothetical protein [Pseudomonadota bacterium]